MSSLTARNEDSPWKVLSSYIYLANTFWTVKLHLHIREVEEKMREKFTNERIERRNVLIADGGKKSSRAKDDTKARIIDRPWNYIVNARLGINLHKNNVSSSRCCSRDRKLVFSFLPPRDTFYPVFLSLRLFSKCFFFSANICTVYLISSIDNEAVNEKTEIVVRHLIQYEKKVNKLSASFRLRHLFYMLISLGQF